MNHSILTNNGGGPVIDPGHQERRGTRSILFAARKQVIIVLVKFCHHPDRRTGTDEAVCKWRVEHRGKLSNELICALYDSAHSRIRGVAKAVMRRIGPAKAVVEVEDASGTCNDAVPERRHDFRRRNGTASLRRALGCWPACLDYAPNWLTCPIPS